MSPVAAPWPLPLWIAHRGAGKLAPENTLAAFRLGAGYGYRAFECDVKLSADGVPFLLHDDDLDRTTSGHGPAGALPWAELSRLDAGGWHSRAFAGEPLPLLDAIARYVQRNRWGIDIEIKPSPGTEHATGVAVAAACQRTWQGSGAPQPVLSSFRPAALQGARDSAPALRRALLVDELWNGWWDVAQELGCAAVIARHTLVDAAFVRQLHGAGLRALCYTVNADEDVQRVLDAGIDGIVTDAIDRHSPVVDIGR